MTRLCSDFITDSTSDSQKFFQKSRSETCKIHLRLINVESIETPYSGPMYTSLIAQFRMNVKIQLDSEAQWTQTIKGCLTHCETVLSYLTRFFPSIKDVDSYKRVRSFPLCNQGYSPIFKGDC